MEISVIIPTHNRSDKLKDCLRCLKKQSFAGEYEVVVFDDGSANPAAVEQAIETVDLPHVQLIHSEKSVGPAVARNYAVNHASGKTLLFTDDDTLPTVNWIKKMHESIQNGFDVVEGKVSHPGETRPLFSHIVENKDGEEFITANIAYTREAFEAVGGFCKRFKNAHREDSDLAFAVMESGASFAFNEKALVEHPITPQSFTNLITKPVSYEYDPLLYKRHPSLYRRFLIAPIQLFDPLYLSVLLLSLASPTFLALTPIISALEAKHYDQEWNIKTILPYSLARLFSSVLLFLSVIRGCVRFKVNPISLYHPIKIMTERWR